MLELVRAEFERSVASLGDGDNTSPAPKRLIEGLIGHLAALYWMGALPLEGGLLGSFYAHASAPLRGQLLKHVGFAFFHADVVDPAVASRVRALWLHRFRATEAAPDPERQEELEPFGWWFASGKFENVWALEQLRRLLDSGIYPDLDHAVADALGKLAPTEPGAALACLDRMLADDGADAQWRTMRCRRGVTAVLTAILANPNTEVARGGARSCNRLVARGNTDFMALLSTADRPTQTLARADGATVANNGVGRVVR